MLQTTFCSKPQFAPHPTPFHNDALFHSIQNIKLNCCYKHIISTDFDKKNILSRFYGKALTPKAALHFFHSDASLKCRKIEQKIFLCFYCIKMFSTICVFKIFVDNSPINPINVKHKRERAIQLLLRRVEKACHIFIIMSFSTFLLKRDCCCVFVS